MPKLCRISWNSKYATLLFRTIVDRLYACVYSCFYHEASDFQVFALRPHLDSPDADPSNLQQVPIAVLGSAAPEAREEVKAGPPGV